MLKMNEKAEMPIDHATHIREGHLEDGTSKRRSEPGRFRSRRTLRNYLFLVLSIFFTIIYVIPTALDFTRPSPHPPEPQYKAPRPTASGLVPLEAHIMSKCPDARDCLRDLVVPAMERISDKVDFTLSYIGSVAADDTIHCKHGSTECLGNMLGLCAAELFPKDIKRSLGFSTCMISSYQQIPNRDLVEQCALEHGISFDDLNACISEEGKGLDLLEASVERSRKAGVQKSCTVRVAGEKWCIRDGAEWKDCPDGHEVDDLVQAVEKLYKSS